jgi:hypothetical protein
MTSLLVAPVTIKVIRRTRNAACIDDEIFENLKERDQLEYVKADDEI